MAEILIVDDDRMLCDMVIRKFRGLNHSITAAHSLREGKEIAAASRFDIILLDVRLPDGSGLEEIPAFKSSLAQPEIIIITGEGDMDGAKIAIETGAWDYIEKPLSMREIVLQLNQALLYRREKEKHEQVRILEKTGIIGEDPKLKRCLEQVALAASTDAPVLISGETGTGKELFARAVHANSRRSDGPFVVLDCAALPENLVGSLLFGHVKGAYTGAESSRGGLIYEARQGTLFMDEVGEMPLEVQKTFLRVLQERTFRPVGGTDEQQSDFRLVTATNRDLEQMVEDGLFRKDLLYRLRSSTIQLPPLRERMGDIESLALYHITSCCKHYGIPIKGVSREYIAALQQYSWPGNVRELLNTIDSTIGLAQMHDTLFSIHLPATIRVSIKQSGQLPRKDPAAPVADFSEADSTRASLKEVLEKREKSYLQDLILQTQGDIRLACSISGLSRSGLYARLKKYGIDRSMA